MAYNKAKEEKKWHFWKEAEEKELRRLGVNEDVIKRLREADWDDFKAERRFFEHHVDTDTYLEWQAADEAPRSIHTEQDLLDDIDSAELHRLLTSVDKLTLQILLMKLKGYSSAEIAERTELSINTVDNRIWRFKKKLKKNL